MGDLKEIVVRYAKAGLSVIPVQADKTPALPSWGEYQKRLPIPEEVKTWFSKKCNLAIVCGAVSENLEILDFDCQGKALRQWATLVQELDKDVLNKIVMETSPHGVHVLYRCKDVTIPGNMKLARKAIKVPGPGEHQYRGKTLKARKLNGSYYIIVELIETRGEGGYCIVHPSEGYELKNGSLLDIPVITKEEREILIEAARACNEWIPPQDVNRGYRVDNGGSKLPGQDFDERGDIRPLLEKHGWTYKRNGGDGRERWGRPGKNRGHSATLTDGKVFYCFSSNGHPFEAGKAYGPFAVYAMLEHSGDFKEASKALAEQGYGSRPQTKATGKVSGVGYSELKSLFSEKAEYLFRKRVPKGMPAAITGPPGIGKTSIALAVAKEIFEQHREGMVIWVSTEGQTQDTFIKIGEIGGALLDTSRFQVARRGDGSFMFNFHHESDRKALDEFLSSLPGPVLLVIIDSLRGASEKIDENSKIMGDMMNRTQAYICDKHRAGCLWIHHWNKKRGVSDSERISGNTAIIGAVRVAFSVIEESNLVRKLAVTKKNLTDVETEPLKVIKTASGFLFYEDGPTKASLLKRAEEFLIDLFSDIKVQEANTVYSEGEKVGLKPGVLKAAKKHLPIITYPRGKVGSQDQRWVWEWKQSYRETEPCLSGKITKMESKKPSKINERHERQENTPKTSRETQGSRETGETFEEKKYVSRKKPNNINDRASIGFGNSEYIKETNKIEAIEEIPEEGIPF